MGAPADVRVRHATEDDAGAITRIYNEGIADRIATFETEPRDLDRIARELRDRPRRYPTVVVERDGRIVAWAAASEYRPRECYAGIGEFSVYVERASRGQGLGKVAMEALIAASAELGLWKLVSRVFPENEASLALLRTLGFREVGLYRRHGKLDGAWRDVVIVELLIGEAAG